MINDGQVYLAGYVASPPSFKITNGKPSASVRVAFTPRWMNRDTGEWSDGPTSFVTVHCWRALAGNVAMSLHKGEPVLVMGRLRVRRYQDREGVTKLAVEVEANSVGHDLSRGAAVFSRTRHAPAEAPAQAMAAEAGDAPAGGTGDAPAGGTGDAPAGGAEDRGQEVPVDPEMPAGTPMSAAGGRPAGDLGPTYGDLETPDGSPDFMGRADLMVQGAAASTDPGHGGDGAAGHDGDESQAGGPGPDGGAAAGLSSQMDSGPAGEVPVPA